MAAVMSCLYFVRVPKCLKTYEVKKQHDEFLIVHIYNWDLDRFVEYNSPLKGKAILSPDNNSSHWNRKNNSSVMTNNHSPRRDEIKNQDKKSR